MSKEIGDLAIRALAAVACYSCDDLWCRDDGEYAPLTIFVNCNDLFFWGCSDCETVTAENINTLEQAYKDSKNNGGILFCCRARAMRPQGAYYQYIEKGEKHLFDACGPDREADFGNPKNQKEFDQ